MSEDFLNILYNEEQSIYNEVVKNPLFDQLLTIQKLIRQRGGMPKYLLNRTALINPKERKVAEETIDPIVVDGYDEKWVWDKKTVYALQNIGGKGSPKDIIDFISNIEFVSSDNTIDKDRIANNVYNSITKLKRKGFISKDETIVEYPLYVYNEETMYL